MSKKRILFITLFVLLLLVSACHKQTGESFVPTGEKKSAVTVNDEAKEVTEGTENIREPEERNKESQETAMTNKASFSFRISRNYGAVTLAEKDMLLEPKMSVMDGLYQLFPDEMETAYGGSYVKGIGTWRSEFGGLGKPNKDWFFFVNGIFADVGALDYFPQAGEKVWWDYHPWQTLQAANGVIGCYPEPFLHGYRGETKATTILYHSADQGLALQLEEALKISGVQEIVLGVISEEFLADRTGPALVLGEWQELKQYAYLAELNQAYERNGTFMHFTESSLELLDYNGKKIREETAEVGVIAVSGKTAGDDSPLWIITGIDQEGLKNAVTLFVEKPRQISGCYSVAAFPTEVIRLPLMPQE